MSDHHLPQRELDLLLVRQGRQRFPGSSGSLRAMTRRRAADAPKEAPFSANSLFFDSLAQELLRRPCSTLSEKQRVLAQEILARGT